MLLFRLSFSYFAVIFLAIAPINFTSAGKFSAAPQKIADYYVYRSLITAFGKQQRKMLPYRPSDSGLHKDGGLNFLEFENLVSRENKILTTADYAAAGVNDLDDPDLKSVSSFLVDKKKYGDVKSDWYFVSDKKKYPDVISLTRQAFFNAYVELYKQDRQSELTLYSTKIKEALKNVVEVRTSELVTNSARTTGVIAELKKKIPGIHVVTDKQTWALDNRVTLYSINVGDTIKQSSGLKGFTVDDMNRIIQDYGKGGTDSVADKHFAISRQYSFWQRDIEVCE